MRTLPFIIFLLIPILTTKAQDTLSVEQRVNLLEHYNKEVLDQKFNTKSEALGNQIQNEISRAKDEVYDELRSIKIFGGVCSFILAIGLLTVIVQYFYGVKRMAEKLLNKKLESHLKENTQHIIDVVTSQKIENQIRAKKKILVVSADPDETESTMTLLKSMKFSNVTGVTAQTYQDLPDSDLVVLSNKGNTLAEDVCIEFLNHSEDKSSYVFYGARLNFDSKAPYAERLNFSNSRHTLYHQIINTLTFQEIMK